MSKVSTKNPLTEAMAAAGMKIVTSIEIRPEDAGKTIKFKANGATITIPTALAPKPIERPQPWTGERPTTDFPSSVIGVLRKLNDKKAGGGFVVNDAELLAAKKNFMQYVGLGAHLKADGSNLKFSGVYDTSGKETTSGITGNGFLYGSMTTADDRQLPFFLNIYTEPKFSDEDLAKLKGFFERDAK